MYNVLKFQAPFERLKLYNESSEVNLYKAIIIQAIIDSTNVSKEPREQKITNEAKEWIFGHSEYFQEICLKANLEPFFVINLAKSAMNLHSSRIDSHIKRLIHQHCKNKTTKLNLIA
jgi:hypothetical protein